MTTMWLTAGLFHGSSIAARTASGRCATCWPAASPLAATSPAPSRRCCRGPVTMRLRTDQGDDLRPHPRPPAQRPRRRLGALGRPSTAPSAKCSTPRAAGAAGRGRALDRRRRSRAAIAADPDDRGARFRPDPAARRAPLPQRRPRPPLAQRDDRDPRPGRPAAEGARGSDRAGRGRAGAARPRRGRRRGGRSLRAAPGDRALAAYVAGGRQGRAGPGGPARARPGAPPGGDGPGGLGAPPPPPPHRERHIIHDHLPAPTREHLARDPAPRSRETRPRDAWWGSSDGSWTSRTSGSRRTSSRWAATRCWRWRSSPSSSARALRACPWRPSSRPRRRGAGRAVGPGAAPRRWANLVALQPHGLRSPLFVVTAGGGDVVGFGPAAIRISPDQPVYACSRSGLDGHQAIDRGSTRWPPATSRESGPCSLRRYLLAGPYRRRHRRLEIAQRLRRAGEEVPFCWRPWTPSLPRPVRSGSSRPPFVAIMEVAWLRARDAGKRCPTPPARGPGHARDLAAGRGRPRHVAVLARGLRWRGPAGALARSPRLTPPRSSSGSGHAAWASTGWRRS